MSKTPFSRRNLWLLMLQVALLASVSACGNKGDLARPEAGETEQNAHQGLAPTDCSPQFVAAPGLNSGPATGPGRLPDQALGHI